jgi:hypothetical protein
MMQALNNRIARTEMFCTPASPDGTRRLPGLQEKHHATTWTPPSTDQHMQGAMAQVSRQNVKAE